MKIRKLSFTIIYSTTITLPAWRKACHIAGQPAHLIPRDVKTRWNSTYDMLKFALEYHSIIDSVTGNKSLKLCQYELDDGDWDVIKDLLHVLKVTMSPHCVTSKLNITARCTRTQLYFSLKIVLSLLPMSCQQWTGSTLC
jgi:hypothetical protein